MLGPVSDPRARHDPEEHNVSDAPTPKQSPADRYLPAPPAGWHYGVELRHEDGTTISVGQAERTDDEGTLRLVYAVVEVGDTWPATGSLVDYAPTLRAGVDKALEVARQVDARAAAVEAAQARVAALQAQLEEARAAAAELGAQQDALDLT